MTNDRFDNVYLNKYFVEVNQRRLEMGKETALPLQRKERGKYVQVKIFLSNFNYKYTF